MNNIFEKKTLKKTLKNKYPHILKSIENEGYNLDYMHYDIMTEIKFEDEIVGFITLSRFDMVENFFAINEAYIIPDYRGKNLLFKYLTNMFLFDNFRCFARKPTKAFINVLLKNDYALKLTSDFVVSYIKFIVDIDDVYKNRKIKKFYKKPRMEIPYKANLFDMNLCSVMFRDPECNFIKYTNFFACTLPRKYDLKKYKCRKKLKKVTEGYLDEKYLIRESNDNKITKFIKSKDDEFDELLNIENMMGTEDELCEEFINDLKQYDLSVDDGFKIRQHIVEGLESGQLTKTSYWQRMMYLLSNIEAVNWSVDDYDENIEECPFCNMPIPDFVNSCLNCGLSIRDIDFEEYSIEKTMNENDNILDNEERIENMIIIHENDELTEEKTFFNQYMLDYDFQEFLEYLNHSDKTFEITEIADSFVTEKLTKELGSEGEFDAYMKYLLYHCNLDMDNKNFEDAFICYAQMNMLMYNYPKKITLLNTSYLVDAYECYSELYDSNYQFNIPKLFDESIKSFKIEKYNKSHDDILFALNDMFKK